MTAFPFMRRTHVENLQFAARLLHFVHGHLRNRFERKTGVVPRLHSANKIPGKFRETGPHEIAHDILQLIVIFEHEQDGLIRIKE